MRKRNNTKVEGGEVENEFQAHKEKKDDEEEEDKEYDDKEYQVEKEEEVGERGGRTAH